MDLHVVFFNTDLSKTFLLFKFDKNWPNIEHVMVFCAKFSGGAPCSAVQKGGGGGTPFQHPTRLPFSDKKALCLLYNFILQFFSIWKPWSHHLFFDTIWNLKGTFCFHLTEKYKFSARTNIPIPKWVLMLAYLAVPVRFLFSLYGMCWWVRGSLYFFAKPKSMMYTRLPFLPSPIKKLSGLMSRCIKFLQCTYSILLIWNIYQEHKLCTCWPGKYIMWITAQISSDCLQKVQNFHTELLILVGQTCSTCINAVRFNLRTINTKSFQVFCD